MSASGRCVSIHGYRLLGKPARIELAADGAPVGPFFGVASNMACEMLRFGKRLVTGKTTPVLDGV
jgi:hypothetical protein